VAREEDPRPEIWILGDSFINGWGNDDQTTMPFFLQRYLPDRRIVNYAVSGYGNVQAYLQLNRDLPRATPGPEAIVVGYADYYNERNVAASTRLEAFRGNADADRAAHWTPADLARFLHPRASRQDGHLVIDYVPLFPPDRERQSQPPDPSLAEQYEVTCLILDSIAKLASAAGARLYLAYLQGPDEDPVVAAMQSRYTIADLRPDPRRREWDDFRPLDSHPGPLAQSTYAWKLYRALASPEVTSLEKAKSDRSL
jgi:hypothetical protein